jgi:hypothetical protein
MGTATIPVTTLADRSKQAVYVPSLRGRLYAASAFILDTDIHEPDIFVELGTIGPEHTEAHRSIVLASGYISSTASVTWTGALPLGPTDEAYIYIWSSSAATLLFRVTTGE